MIVGKKKFNYGEVTTEPIYEGLAVAANGIQINEVFIGELLTTKYK